jgi:hypothetical protein
MTHLIAYSLIAACLCACYWIKRTRALLTAEREYFRQLRADLDTSARLRDIR